MKKLLIEQCSDRMMWYADKIGKLVPYLGKFPEGDYASVDEGGFTNIVREKDCRIIDVGCLSCLHSQTVDFLVLGEYSDHEHPCRGCQDKDEFKHWELGTRK